MTNHPQNNQHIFHQQYFFLILSARVRKMQTLKEFRAEFHFILHSGTGTLDNVESDVLSLEVVILITINIITSYQHQHQIKDDILQEIKGCLLSRKRKRKERINS